ncbi:MAG: hypothetical protein CUN56_01220 [Phototrophicales bacterium]|nr:MAG: hypothetical protein CUN56_01220 [Phototrophicales bacterium]RMG72392.1 MAG: hypothetical protein D6711_13040 [Chloroflexota bacterium]
MSHHQHPKPFINRLAQTITLLAAILIVLAAIGSMILVLIGAPTGFALVGGIALLLIFPLVMQTAIAPAVTVDDTGLTLHPLYWKSQHIGWDDIKAVKVFPLLPSKDEEITRKYAVGKQRYRAAEGIMLVIPSLPMQYRIAGFFAGERAQPVIALTNRAHTDYDTLLKKVLEMTDTAIHDDALLPSERIPKEKTGKK